MLTCFLRSGLMVKLETPMSYLPLVTPRMIVSNPAGCHSVLRPSLAATALNTSTSKPSTVLPSAPSISLGAYVGSVPIVMTPLLLRAAGTLAASAWSTPPPAGVVAAPPDAEPPLPGLVDREFDPQADSERPAATRPVTAMRDMRRMLVGSFRAMQRSSKRDGALAGSGRYCHLCLYVHTGYTEPLGAPRPFVDGDAAASALAGQDGVAQPLVAGDARQVAPVALGGDGAQDGLGVVARRRWGRDRGEDASEQLATVRVAGRGRERRRAGEELAQCGGQTRVERGDV